MIPFVPWSLQDRNNKLKRSNPLQQIFLSDMFEQFCDFLAHNEQLNPKFFNAKGKINPISVFSDLSDNPLVTSIDERCFQNLTSLQKM